MTKRSERWVPVADAVLARMADLGWHHHADLYRASGLSEPTVRPLITAELRGRQEPTDATCKKVAAALGWSTDSIERILRGEEPREIRPPATRPDESALGQRVRRLQLELQELGEVVELQALRIARLERSIDGPDAGVQGAP